MTNTNEAYFILIDKDIWDWVINKDQEIPTGFFNQWAMEDSLDFESEEEAVKYFVNSNPNDRALCIPEYSGIGFYDIKSYTEFVVKNNVKIIDYFAGYIY